MTSERWQQVRDVFTAVQQCRLEDREAFLESACSDAPDLLAEVRALLEAHDRQGPVDHLASAIVSPLLSGLAVPIVAGTRVGRYEVVDEVGRGGMGVVYRARDPQLQRFVAVKLLPQHLSAQQQAKVRFLAEARAASALDHANICTIYEAGETDDGRLYIAMPYYEGRTLKQRIAEGPVPVDECIDLALQAAAGLAQAHAAGIVHRDVKPANVIVTAQGQVKLLDFGVAKLEHATDLTKPGSRIGTIAYMAPEQVRGEPADPRVDVWALGVVLYELLTGERPFPGAHEAAVMYAIVHSDPAPVSAKRPEVPGALEQVIERALAKDPAARYRDAGEMMTALQAAQQAPASTAPRPPRARPRRYSHLLGYSGVLLLVAVLLLGWYRFSTDRPAPIRSIAVLPLANRSGDPDQEYFADGMTDELIVTLGQIDALRVISRSSVMPYKAAPRPVREVAQELNVDAVVEGSVMTVGDQVRITVQLVDAATDRMLWSHSFQRELRDVLGLQRDVALAIAGAVEAELTPQEQAGLASARPVDPDAYRLYLYGQHFRNEETPESWRKAVTYFEQAVARDTAFALAYAGLARVYTQLGAGHAQEAEAAAERALALDPTQSSAYVSIGLIREMLEWDWDGAEEAFRHAIRLNPGDGEAHHELALLLMRRGRFDEALASAERALEIDPLSMRYQNGVAEFHLFGRRYERAIELLRQALTLDPDNSMTYWRLGQAYLETGRHADAIDAFEQMVALGGYQPYGHLGHALAVAGRPDEARRVLDDMLSGERATSYGAGWVSYNAALVLTGLGRHDEALDRLDQAYAERSNLLMYAGIVPAFDPLRSHPRFTVLLRRIGLQE